MKKIYESVYLDIILMTKDVMTTSIIDNDNAAPFPGEGKLI